MRTLLACWLVTMPVTGAADTIDHPTAQHAKLRGSAHVTGVLTRDLGFAEHVYTATRDGFVRVTLETSNGSGNHGRAWRPYLRIVSVPSDTRRGEGWSTNGTPGDASRASASLILRVSAGEQFTIVATLGENVSRGRPAATASYDLATAEILP